MAIDQTEPQRPEPQRAEPQRAESQRAESQRAESQRAESQRAESQRAEPQRAESQRAESQRAESQRAESQRAESHGEAPPRRDSPLPEPLRELVEPPPVPAMEAPIVPVLRREPAAVYVVGFWRRLAAAVIDLALVIPAALLVTLSAIRITGVHMPPDNLRVIDLDLWIDLVLATDPALVMALVLFGAIGLTYLLVFQITVGRTLGMRVLNIKIIDAYGDRPSAARCVARCAGYLAGVATLFLGFLWMGFDSEKRGLQDWIAGTYVIRA